MRSSVSSTSKNLPALRPPYPKTSCRSSRRQTTIKAFRSFKTKTIKATCPTEPSSLRRAPNRASVHARLVQSPARRASRAILSKGQASDESRPKSIASRAQLMILASIIALWRICQVASLMSCQGSSRRQTTSKALHQQRLKESSSQTRSKSCHSLKMSLP